MLCVTEGVIVAARVYAELGQVVAVVAFDESTVLAEVFRFDGHGCFSTSTGIRTQGNGGDVACELRRCRESVETTGRSVQCPSPLKIKVPITDGRGFRMQAVPCGRCVVCLTRRRADWFHRLSKEYKYCPGPAYFITLTYDDEHLPMNGDVPSVRKSDVQLFMKRLRKYLSDHADAKLRFYITSEYGPTTQRPHYHGVLFFDRDVCFDASTLSSCWKLGFVKVDPVTPARIAYVTKYCVKFQSNPPHADECFSLMSRRPGIGAAYLERARDYHSSADPRNYLPSPGGERVPLPRYYRDKFFDSDTRASFSAPVSDYDKLREEGLSHREAAQTISARYASLCRRVEKSMKKSQL